MQTTTLSGPWSMAQVERFLDDSVIPLRLSVLGADGWPFVVSHWFRYEDGRFHCAARVGAAVIACLRRDPRCGFEIAADQPPYRGVRGRGEAALSEDHGKKRLTDLHERYLGAADTDFRRWLLGARTREMAITITPTRLMSWDYRTRMSP